MHCLFLYSSKTIKYFCFLLTAVKQQKLWQKKTTSWIFLLLFCVKLVQFLLLPLGATIASFKAMCAYLYFVSFHISLSFYDFRNNLFLKMQQNENSFLGGVFWQHLLNMDGNGVLGQLEIENPRKFED